MGDPDLEDLFLRFRDKGDANALATVFDRTASELLTLALHLAPESSAAEDLVQATFLAAIQGADSFERGRRLMPWLVGILANQAARARRDRARVIDPSRVDTRPEPDPAHTTEQREVLATLTRAIDELPDTCRESVRRHLLEGERAVDIARADGTAPGTVRMQILRGLDRLRRTLPASLLSVGPIVIESGRMTTIRSVVLSAAHSHVAAASVATASASAASSGTGAGGSSLSVLVPAIGGTFVMLKLGLAALVLIVAGLVGWRASQGSVSPVLAVPTQDSLSRADIDVTGPAATPERAVAATSTTQLGSSSTTAATRTQAGWWLTGVVHGIAGLNVAQTIVSVQALPGSSHRVSVHPDSDGHFALDVSNCFREEKYPDYLVVYARHPTHADADTNVSVEVAKAAAGSRERVEWNVDLQLKTFALLTGRIDLPAGEVPDSIPVVLMRNNGGDKNPAWNKLSSSERRADGTFELRIDGSGDALLVAQAEGLVPTCTPAHFESGIKSDVGTLQLVRGGVSLEGRLELGFVAPGAQRALGASVDARRPGAKPLAGDAWHGARFTLDPRGIPRVEVSQQRAQVDADGAFRFNGLPSGEWDLELVLADVMQLGPRTHTFLVPGPPVVLGADLSRWNIHVASKGKPLSDAKLVATLAERSPQAWTGADGRAQVVAPFSTGWDLDVSAPGFADKHVTISPAAQPSDSMLEIELALADDLRAKLVLNVKDESNAPDSAQVTLRPIGWESETSDTMFRIGAGPYELDRIPPGRWSVVVKPAAKSWFGMPGGSDVQDVQLEVVLAPHERRSETITFVKGGRVEFEVDGWNEIRTGNGPWAHVHVHDSALHPIATSIVVRDSQFGNLSLVSYDDQIPLYAPSTLRASLPAGAYTLELDDPVWTGSSVAFQVKVGETTKVRVAVARR